MFLNTVNAPCVRVLLDPQTATLYGMVPVDEEPQTWLSRDQLQLYYRGLFPCLAMDITDRRRNVVEQVRTNRRRRQDIPDRRLGVLQHIRNTRQPNTPTVPQDKDSAQPTPDTECAICLRPFSEDNPQKCLPCMNLTWNMMRHCVACKNCLEDLMVRARVAGFVQCPLCRTRFNIHQLRQALEIGCLDYPIGGVSPMHTLKGWHAGELEEKQNCLTNIEAIPDIITLAWAMQPSDVATSSTTLLVQVPPLSSRLVVTPLNYFQTLQVVVQRHQPGYLLKMDQHVPCLQESLIQTLVLGSSEDAGMHRQEERTHADWAASLDWLRCSWRSPR